MILSEVSRRGQGPKSQWIQSKGVWIQPLIQRLAGPAAAYPFRLLAMGDPAERLPCVCTNFVVRETVRVLITEEIMVIRNPHVFVMDFWI